VVRTALDTAVEHAWAGGAVRLIDDGFPPDSHEIANWLDWERLLPHVLTVAERGERLAVEQEAVLNLQDRAAMYLRGRGQYQQAEALLETTVAGRRRVQGNDHPMTLTSMNNLTITVGTSATFTGAHELFEQSVAARSLVLGEDHPETLWSVNNLAVTRRCVVAGPPWPAGAKSSPTAGSDRRASRVFMLNLDWSSSKAKLLTSGWSASSRLRSGGRRCRPGRGSRRGRGGCFRRSTPALR
jgi:hypothetical protein